MPLHGRLIESPRPLSLASPGVVLLVIALAGAPIAPAAQGLKSADEIARALSGQPAPAAGEPTFHFRGVRPHPKVSEPPAERRIDLTILFATDSDAIERASRGQIAQIAASARQLDFGQNQLLILGHTDTRGPAGHNLDLSRRRASAVKQALVADYGLTDSDLLAEGKGAPEPLIAPERGPADRAKNRRVELRLVGRPAAGQ